MRATLGAVLALTITATALHADPLPVEAAPAGGRPAVPADAEPAPARPAPKSRTALPDHAAEQARTAPPTYSWPSAGTTEVAVADTAKPRAKLRILASPERADTGPNRVEVQTFGKDVADRALSNGPVMRLSPGAGETAGQARMSFDYGSFAGSTGGDLGGRLALVSLPECALTTPEATACAPTPLATTNDGATRKLTADVRIASAGTLVAMQASEGSAKGTYGATPLNPSSTWSVATSSGSFSWSYPLRVPPVPGGFGPTVSFDYNSQSMDGQTAATNNQGSWIGAGFGYEPGYVERRYQPCADDGHKEVGDLCWAHDNATLSLNGSSAELVRSGNTWKLANDNGSRIERLTGAANGDGGDNGTAGEHWKLTTIDGSQYVFGLNRLPGWTTGATETNSTWTVPVFGDDAVNNDDKEPGAATGPKEPCYQATFAKAWCQQAWRWNLDYAVDRLGNVITYYYSKEGNAYALGRKTDVNGTAYDRGGYLKSIQYGLREGGAYAASSARVTFQSAERCDTAVNATACNTGNLTDATKAAWPDVPFDRVCAATAKCKTDQVSPTFFTRKRLSTVTTEIRNGSTTYTPVDRFTLGHLYPDNGDGSRNLWLHTIKQEGLYGGGDALASPAVRLDVKQLANRIRKPGDMLGEFVRPRVGTVYNETGGQIDVQYSEAECKGTALPKEGESTKRCYPVRWHGAGTAEPVTDWFNKYVVKAVRETDNTIITPGTESQPDMVTFYDYQGHAGWRYPEPDGMTEAKYRTWSEWRGYRTVVVAKGTDQQIRTRSRLTYLQGMNADRDPAGGTRSVTVEDSTGVKYVDDKEFLGFEIETEVLDGTNDRVLSKTLTSPAKFTTATQTRTFGTSKASFVRPQTSRSFTGLMSGGWRETKSVTTYDQDYGRIQQVDDLGDVATETDDRCTRTWYADNAGRNLRAFVSRSETVTVNCAATPNRATQVQADGRTYYDGLGLGAAPTRGLATRTERMTANNGTTASYGLLAETTFDVYGRPLTSKDVKNTTSRFTYTETNGLTTRKDEYTPKIAVAGAAPAEFKKTTEYTPAWGLPVSDLDWNSNGTQITYDKLGRVSAMWTPDRDTRSIPTLRYRYVTGGGKPVVVVTEKPAPDAAKTQYEYKIFDGFLRPRQVQTPGPQGGRLVTDTFYTSTGKVDRTNEPYYARGAPSGTLLPTENVDADIQTGYVYDGADRVTDEIAFSAGKEQHRARTVYEGDRTHTIPPNGGTASTSIVDARGRTTEIRYYKNAAPGPDGAPAGAYDRTTYTYTPTGQPATVTNPARAVWKYGYDQLGRKVVSEDPDAGRMQYAYDEADRLIRTVDAKGQTLETEYDDLGRVTGTFQATPAGRVQLTKSVYDQLAGSLGQLYSSTRFVNGQPYSIVNTRRDNLYRATEVAYQIPADAGEALKGTYKFTSRYNFDGTLGGSTMPPGRGGLNTAEGLVYRYDDLRRLVGVSGTDNDYLTDVKYTDEGLVTQAQLDAGGRKSWVTLGYQTETQRLETLMLSRESYVSGDNPTPDRPKNDINQRYAYDDAGNVLSVTDAPSTGPRDVQCFTYDYLRRMTDAYSTGGKDCTDTTVGGAAPYHTSYTFDAVGNRLTESIAAVNGAAGTERTYRYPDPTAARPHALQSVTEADSLGNTKLHTYGYDPTGNMTKRTTAGEDQLLDWDAEGHLATVTAADGKKTSFLYAADGSRMLRREPGATTLYLPGMELRLDTTTNTVADTRFVGLAAGATAVRTAQGIQFQVGDPNGTGQAGVDARTGALTMRRTTPFGSDRGTPPAPGQWSGEKGFVGGTTDSSTGLTHLGAREYDPMTGRFISVDPLIDVTDPQRMNAYGYGNNNPLTSPDPSGLSFCYDTCGMGKNYVDRSEPYPQDAPDPLTGKKSGSSSYSGGGSSAPETKETTKARTEHERVKKELVTVAKTLGKIVMDELGITDALDCFTKGDIGGCASTAVNVVMTVIGGAGGKLISRYLFKLDKLKDLVGNLWNLGGRLKTLTQDFFKSRDSLKRAESAAASLADTAGESCLHSFAPGTRVLLHDGSSKPIEEVEVGDEVVATDPRSGKSVGKPVVATFTNDDTDLTNVTVIDEKKRVVTLETTQHHPFWSRSAQDWVDAALLQPNEILSTPGHGTVRVVTAHNFPGARKMHDLTIDDIHTYSVLAGDTPTLVHNCDPSEQSVTLFRNVTQQSSTTSPTLEGSVPEKGTWKESGLRRRRAMRTYGAKG